MRMQSTLAAIPEVVLHAVCDQSFGAMIAWHRGGGRLGFR